MTVPQYLPAIRTEARNQRLDRLSVRSSDDRQLGELLGFLIDPASHHVRSLVMEVVSSTGSQQVELPLVACCFDAESPALRMIEDEVPSMTAFRPESAAAIDEDDLWDPYFHSAA